MAPNGPRNSIGARGLGSQVSIWPGPPLSQNRITLEGGRNRVIVDDAGSVNTLIVRRTALPQTVEGQSREWPFRYIDWDDARANAFHMTSEFSVDWPEGASIRPRSTPSIIASTTPRADSRSTSP